MNFGWKKDKWDRKDYLHKPTIPAIPDNVNMYRFLPKRRDQGNDFSCVGFGLAINVTAVAKKLGVYTEWFSPRDIYNGARFIEGALNQAGAYPKYGFDWMLEKGCLLEHFWPYKVPDNAAPKSSLDPERAKWPLLAYYRVDNGLDGILSALAEGNFVSLGSPWFASWLEPANVLLPKVTRHSGIVGGHETCLFGYDKPSGNVFVVNSWGRYWGCLGCCFMPFSAFEVFKEVQGYDAHYVKVKWE